MVFSLGCLKKSLLALVAVSLLVSIGQLVLIFINNKIFGAIMFVMYILFFLAILLALCRDSVSMYAACTVLLIVFVIGCSLIQAYDVEVKDLLKLESTTTEESSTETTTPPPPPPDRRRRDVLHQVLQSEAQWKPQGQVTAWPPAEDRLPMYPVNSQPIPMEAPPDQRQAQQSFDYQPAPSLPPQPSLLPPNVPEVTIFPKYEPRQGPKDPPNTTTSTEATSPLGPDDEPEEPQKKKYRWRNELRWVSNVLGVLHILILAVVICILYEMLFGGRYRYRTWC